MITKEEIEKESIRFNDSSDAPQAFIFGAEWVIGRLDELGFYKQPFQTTYVNLDKPSQDEISKREYFAAMAMQASISHKDFSYNDIAKHAVMCADNLIKELAKTK